MKASELIEKLRTEIMIDGDHEVYFGCDHLDENESEFWIDGMGFSVGRQGERRILVMCGECHHDAITEKHTFDV